MDNFVQMTDKAAYPVENLRPAPSLRGTKQSRHRRPPDNRPGLYGLCPDCFTAFAGDGRTTVIARRYDEAILAQARTAQPPAPPVPGLLHCVRW
ncbi:MAG: hypothetical protein LBJ47_07975 [Tannerella sp.]|nr:hypothetical protein [Tannerella sp.]